MLTNTPWSLPPRRRPRDGGFALVTAIVFLFVILMIGSSMVQQAVQELDTASRAKRETQAFNLAEAGIEYGAWQLYNNPTTSLPTSWTRNDLPEGSFTVTADDFDATHDTVVLVSTGTAYGWTSQVKVVGRFLSTGPTDQNVVFDHAVFSNSDMTLSGSFDITGDAHANGSITLKGSPTVNGDVSAMGSIKTQGSPNVSGSQLPNQPRVAMPTIDLAYYRAKATTVLTGDHSFTGTTDLDGITFVQGNVTINGSFRGKGVIVVTGSTRINGNALLTQASDEFALVCAGGVKINGNCRIEGWIYAHNVDVPSIFEGNGNADVVGGVASDVIRCNGSMKVTYKTVTVELPGAEVAPSQFDAVSWRRVR